MHLNFSEINERIRPWECGENEFKTRNVVCNKN